MLISTQLEDLGDILHVSGKETMETKGVASVRSPVNSLRQFSPDKKITHEHFCEAIVQEFCEEYGHEAHVEPIYVDGQTPTDLLDMNEGYIRRGMEELATWDWLYGQTPEFTYILEKTFSWGHVIVEIKSKHGVILECRTTLGTPTLAHIQDAQLVSHSDRQWIDGPTDLDVDILPIVQKELENPRGVSGSVEAVLLHAARALQGQIYGDARPLEDLLIQDNQRTKVKESYMIQRDFVDWLKGALTQ